MVSCHSQAGTHRTLADTGTSTSAISGHSFVITKEQELVETLESVVSDLCLPTSHDNGPMQQGRASGGLGFVGNSAGSPASRGKGDIPQDRTVRLVAIHELRTGFYAEESDLIDGTIIRRPVDATKLDQIGSKALR